MKTASWTRARQLVIVLFTASLSLFPFATGPSAGFAQGSDESGVAVVTGMVRFTSSNPPPAGYEPFVLLNDLTSFVTRKPDWEAPILSQVIAPVTLDKDSQARFTLPLPIRPQGTAHSFSSESSSTDGVQVFSVEFMFENDGMPFVDPEEFGGSIRIGSLTLDSATGEAIGGSLLVWSEVDGRSFPNGLGHDNALFTDDDPLTELQAGWTAVELDSGEFEQVRTGTYVIRLNPEDSAETAFTDLSDLGYVDSFNALIDQLITRYPFTEEKQVDWEALRSEFPPRVQLAESRSDANIFAWALHDLALSIDDGHMAAPMDLGFTNKEFGGFLGLSFKETDNGELVVTRVWQGRKHRISGFMEGAQIHEWNGDTPDVAIHEQSAGYSTSSPQAARQALIESLSWSRYGDTVRITYQNIGEEKKTLTIEYGEFDSVGQIRELSQFGSAGDDPTLLPITAKILPSGIGYIRITSFIEDPVLTNRAWEDAIRKLGTAEVQRVIVDVRGNRGGALQTALNLARFFEYDAPVVFESTVIDPAGDDTFTQTYEVESNPNQVRFLGVAVLVDASCASACEIFAAAVGESPTALIVGETASAGAVSRVSVWAFPDGNSFTASSSRIGLIGESLLEGAGVVPDVTVPVNMIRIRSEVDDVVLAAENALGGPL